MYFKHSKVDLGGMVREVGWDFVKVREREREREEVRTEKRRGLPPVASPGRSGVGLRKGRRQSEDMCCIPPEQTQRRSVNVIV
jgi:hypothetical protein